MMLLMAGGVSPQARARSTQYTFTKIVDSAENPGAEGPYCVAINDSGVVLAHFATNGLWKGDGASFVQVAANGGVICPSINDQGEIAYAIPNLLDAGGNPYHALVRDSNGVTTVLARSDVEPTLHLGTTYLPSLSNDGRALYQGAGGPFGLGPLDGVFIAPGGTEVYNPYPTQSFATVAAGTMNDAGQAVFWALPGDGTQVIYRAGAPLVSTGTTFSSLLCCEGRPVINSHGRVAFAGGNVNGGGLLWTTDDGVDFTSVSDIGAGNINSYAINDAGTVAYQANPGGQGWVIFAGPDLVADRVIGVGDALDGSTVWSAFLWPEGLNNHGQIAFWAQLADGREGIYRADPVDTVLPVVTPPADTIVEATEPAGATPGASAALSTFLSAATGSDDRDPNPQSLTPQIGGVDITSTTLFPIGSTTVTFRFQDAAGNIGSATATVSVTPPANSAPIAVDSSFLAIEDRAGNGNLSASDPDGDPLTFSVASPPTKGTVVITNPATGRFRYSPAPNANGTDSFTFSVSDGLVADSAVIVVTITPVNDAPATSDLAVSTAPGVPVAVDLSAATQDADGDVLTWTFGQPKRGAGAVTAGATPGLVVYTPPSGFVGTASFTFRASDASSTSRSATVTIAVR